MKETLLNHIFNYAEERYQKSYVHWLYTRIHVEGESIVYCTKCGTNHADDATVCVNCGAPLYGTSGEGRSYVRHGRYEREGFPRRGRPIWGIFIGLIIIFVGFSLLIAELYNIDIPWGPIMLILFGVFVLVRLFQVRSRRR